MDRLFITQVPRHKSGDSTANYVGNKVPDGYPTPYTSRSYKISVPEHFYLPPKGF